MNRLDEAEKSLRRLQSPKATHINPMKTLATIVYTNNLEEQLSVGTSYWDCFKGFERRRTEIACMVFAGQILCGICFAYNSSYFFQNVGMGTSATYSLALGGTALALVGCFVNWFGGSSVSSERLWSESIFGLIIADPDHSSYALFRPSYNLHMGYGWDVYRPDAHWHLKRLD